MMVQSLPVQRDPIARVILLMMAAAVAYLVSAQPAPQQARAAQTIVLATPQPTAAPVPTAAPAPVVVEQAPVAQPTPEPPPPAPVVVEAPAQPAPAPAVIEALPTPAPPAPEPQVGGKSAPDRAAHYYAATGEKPAPPEAQR
jgi:hypothetical protein